MDEATTTQVMYSLGEGFVQTPVPDAEEKITAGTAHCGVGSNQL